MFTAEMRFQTFVLQLNPIIAAVYAPQSTCQLPSAGMYEGVIDGAD